MKILIVNAAREPIGGVETYLRGMAPALAGRGHRLGFACEAASAATDGDDPFAACEREWWLARQPLAALLEETAAWSPDVVWLHNVSQTKLAEQFAALAPCVQSVHDFRGLCATGTRLQRRPAAHACARRLGAACLAIDFAAGCGVRNPRVLLANYAEQTRRRNFLRRTPRRLIACSLYLKAELTRQGVPPERTRTMHYPLFALPEAAPPAPEHAPFRLLCLARLVWEKGVHTLIEALPQASGALGRRLTLTVGGNGPQLARLRARAGRLGVAVEFPGWLVPAARDRALAAADLLVVPSLAPEALGIVGMEAQARAVPAVAFGVGGIPEWLQAGRNGEMASADALNPEHLAAALVRALSSTERWRQMRLHAWDDAHRHSLPAHLDGLEEALHEARGA